MRSVARIRFGLAWRGTASADERRRTSFRTDSASRPSRSAAPDSSCPMRATERCSAAEWDAQHLPTLADSMDTVSRPIGRTAAHMPADRPHNYRLPQTIPGQRLFDASILFCSTEERSKEENRISFELVNNRGNCEVGSKAHIELFMIRFLFNS